MVRERLLIRDTTAAAHRNNNETDRAKVQEDIDRMMVKIKHDETEGERCRSRVVKKERLIMLSLSLCAG